MSSQNAHKLGRLPMVATALFVNRAHVVPDTRQNTRMASKTTLLQNHTAHVTYESMLDRCNGETHCRRPQHVTALDRKIHAIPSSLLTCEHLQEPLPLRGALASFYEWQRRSAELAKHSRWQAMPLMRYNIPQLYKLYKRSSAEVDEHTVCCRRCSPPSCTARPPATFKTKTFVSPYASCLVGPPVARWARPTALPGQTPIKQLEPDVMSGKSCAPGCALLDISIGKFKSALGPSSAPAAVLCLSCPSCRRIQNLRHSPGPVTSAPGLQQLASLNGRRGAGLRLHVCRQLKRRPQGL